MHLRNYKGVYELRRQNSMFSTSQMRWRSFVMIGESPASSMAGEISRDRGSRVGCGGCGRLLVARDGGLPGALPPSSGPMTVLCVSIRCLHLQCYWSEEEYAPHHRTVSKTRLKISFYKRRKSRERKFLKVERIEKSHKTFLHLCARTSHLELEPTSKN